MVQHFIDFNHCDPDFLDRIVSTALAIKKDPARFANALTGQNMYMLFQKTSTRTALSFALGITGLGGSYFMQKWDDSNFAVGEIEDETRYVSRSVDVIMARLKTNQAINLMARYSTVPVINGCCDKYHPCQAMADLVTIKETFGTYAVRLLYVGVRNNVLNSLMESLPRLGGDLYCIAPVVNAPSADQQLYQSALATGRFHDVGSGNPSVDDLKRVVKQVDVIYADTWVDMEFINDRKYDQLRAGRTNKMLPFQINQELLAGSKAIVMHDMPIHTGSEITREVAESNMNTILQQAENRKFAQQAILMALLKQ